MSHSTSLEETLADLRERMEALLEDEDLQEEDGPSVRTYFVGIMREACDLVREAEEKGSADFDVVLNEVKSFLNDSLDAAYGDPGFFDFCPSFAHSEQSPLVEEGGKTRHFSSGALDALLPLLSELSGLDKNKLPLDLLSSFHGPAAWDPAKKRHPKSSPLARFTDPAPRFTATSAQSLANIIHQARCEVSCDDTCDPICMSLSSDNSCLALNAAGGWKNRCPVLELYPLSDDDGEDFPEGRNVRVGLSETVKHLTMDETRKLAFIADSYRTKSYAWAPLAGNASSTNFRPGLAVHTLDTSKFGGPMIVLANGTLVKAGYGKAAVWKIEDLDTHLETKKIGRGKFNIDDSWRDDPEDIERSPGNAPHSTVTFSKADLKPLVWKQVSEGSSVVLGATGSVHETSEYSAFEIDLESGRVGRRYLGHGGTVNGFSVSKGDANVFLTAASDGFARLFDRRRTLPVMTLDVGKSGGTCQAGLLIHPDGIPTVITGADKQEEIKVWDVRARSAAYDLATGNNSVNSLAWDDRRNVLYASTECTYMDRMGGHHGYRRAKIPKHQRAAELCGDDGDGEDGEDREEDWVDEDEEEDEDDDDDDDYEGRCWPSNAWHREDYFGHTFDAGDHRLYRFAFKEDPNLDMIPHYGDATMGRDGFGGFGW